LHNESYVTLFNNGVTILSSYKVFKTLKTIYFLDKFFNINNDKKALFDYAM